MSKPTFLRTISNEAAYAQLKALLATFPTFERLDDDARKWLGRLMALVEEVCDVIDVVGLRTAMSNLTGAHKLYYVGEIKSVLFRAIAVVELGTPAQAQGAFLPAGNHFDALAAVSRILAEARRTVLLVDPYMDARTPTDFAVLAPDGVLIRLLTEVGKCKPSLAPAVQRWQTQYGSARPLEARLAPAKSLHDRSVQVDATAAWITTQSFNALAERSPASLSRLDGEAGQMKIEAYEQLWSEATPLPSN